MSNKNLDNLFKEMATLNTKVVAATTAATAATAAAAAATAKAEAAPRGLIGKFIWNSDDSTHEYTSRSTTDHAEVNVPLEQGRKYKVSIIWTIYFSGASGRYVTFTTSLNGVSRVKKVYGVTETSINFVATEIFEHTGSDVASALCNCVWTGVDIEEGFIYLLCEDVGSV